ncbi:MAG: hypothetical protein LBD36_02525 [Holosporales bacterium]|jgi:trk system potassium uptake protein TrkH|nr:hypothetical protein [Holosporales bacterium]
MCVPILVELVLTGSFQINDFLLPIGGGTFVGGMLFFANKKPSITQIKTADAFLLTSLTWLIVPIFSCLPFYCCQSLNLSFIDSWFEAVSSLTATGCKVIPDLSQMPRWITTWRFLLSYIGGIGMIIMGMTVLPMLKVGGMQLFQTESSGKNEKITSSTAKMATLIIAMYSVLIMLSFILLKMSGLSVGDSLCYAISSISTSGLSIHSDSVASLNNTFSELAILISMVLGGSSFILFIKIAKGNFSLLKTDQQFKGYLKTLLVFSLILFCLRYYNSDAHLLQCIKDGFFNAVSFITTTGFYNSKYETWGSFAVVFFPLISLIGGCTGSTAGGIKIFRWQLIFSCVKAHINQLRRPHCVIKPVYNHLQLSEATSSSMFVFVFLYVASILITSFLLSLYNLDFASSVSAAISAVGNVGIGIGPFVGTNGSVVAIANGAKIILIISMIIGRLELLTLLALFQPSFWK